MRLLIAGLVLLALSVGLTEYDRRRPHTKSDDTSTSSTGSDKKPELPDLLATTTPKADAPAGADALKAAQAVLQAGGAKQANFEVVTTGSFQARELRGGFGAVLFVVDVGTGSAIVRAVAGEPAKVVAARSSHITAMQVDGSTVFFAEGGRVLSMSARGDEAPSVRVEFTKGHVTSLAPVGDTVFVTVLPNGPEKEGAVAKVDSAGVTLIAAGQVEPRDVVADGKDVFWLAGGAVQRAPVDGSFTAKLLDGAVGPLTLDGDALVVSTGEELKRTLRAGGAPTSLVHAHAEVVTASSGLVRYAADGAVFEVSAGSEPTPVFKGDGVPVGLALGGTSLYVLLSAGGTSTLLAK